MKQRFCLGQAAEEFDGSLGLEQQFALQNMLKVAAIGQTTQPFKFTARRIIYRSQISGEHFELRQLTAQHLRQSWRKLVEQWIERRISRRKNRVWRGLVDLAHALSISRRKWTG
ncbi:hypothetical protein [uncultured Erythrobacter sp.]|uniref:hypothetical protein n=1 Tax=uncultured Erythrobacter sp. TaxID=263913 RepID=UPI00261DE838|nr:hypothetical protein [uncultured Erythrobacter sp.]